jgi:hypothetical protein
MFAGLTTLHFTFFTGLGPVWVLTVTIPASQASVGVSRHTNITTFEVVAGLRKDEKRESKEEEK